MKTGNLHNKHLEQYIMSPNFPDHYTNFYDQVIFYPYDFKFSILTREHALSNISNIQLSTNCLDLDIHNFTYYYHQLTTPHATINNQRSRTLHKSKGKRNLNLFHDAWHLYEHNIGEQTRLGLLRGKHEF